MQSPALKRPIEGLHDEVIVINACITVYSAPWGLSTLLGAEAHGERMHNISKWGNGMRDERRSDREAGVSSESNVYCRHPIPPCFNLDINSSRMFVSFTFLHSLASRGIEVV